MSELLDTATRGMVGSRDIPAALFAPRKLFARVEDVPVYGWPLAILLTAVTLTGWATVQTGLVDQEVDRQVLARIALIEAEQHDVVERSALREMYENQNKRKKFEKVTARILAVAAEPVQTLASVMLIAAFLYGVVALTGRKPEWHTLMNICVFAGFADALRALTVFLLMLRYGTLHVDTSLALLTRFMNETESVPQAALAAISGMLSALDPFRIWFWMVVILGLSATAQLRGWRAWATCSLCWFFAAGGRAALAAAQAAGAAQAAATHP